MEKGGMVKYHNSPKHTQQPEVAQSMEKAPDDWWNLQSIFANL